MRTLDYDRIFIRYDLVMESKEPRRRPRLTVEDKILQEVIDGVIEGDVERTRNAVLKALKSREPLDILREGLIKGMDEVSTLWEEGVYYLPQTLNASDAMLRGIQVLEEHLGRPVERKALVITHTAEGDIHDLGQQIVNTLLRANGFEVLDLGKDVPVEEVVAAVLKYRPVMVTGTSLMTTCAKAFQRISQRLTSLGVNIPFVCGGGGGVTPRFVHSYELGIYGEDAAQAPWMAQDAVAGMSWQELRRKYNPI